MLLTSDDVLALGQYRALRNFGRDSQVALPQLPAADRNSGAFSFEWGLTDEEVVEEETAFQSLVV